MKPTTDRKRSNPARYLEVSSRIQRYYDGEISAGASCNTFVVDDSMESIIAAWAWSAQVSRLQGAPTVIMSNIRPRNSKISSGGFASGPSGYARVFDSIADTMMRPGKKNGVCALFIDADHPDLDEWLTISGVLKRAYLGVLFRPGKVYSQEVLDKVAMAYDTWHIAYICKTQQGPDGETLYPNVCTEIRQSHKGQCILGALKVQEFHKLTPLQIIKATRAATHEMVDALVISRRNAEKRPDLFSYERQVGLGFVGMANWIGGLGTTYENLNRYWATAINGFLGDPTGTPIEMEQLIPYLYELDQEDQCPESRFWLSFVSMIAAGDEVAMTENVTRLWTAQPTNHTSLRMGSIKELAPGNLQGVCDRDPAVSRKVAKLKQQLGISGNPNQAQAIQIMDTLGIPLGLTREIHDAVAAELQPPMGVRTSDSVNAIQQSELTGDTLLHYHPSIQTRDEVPYEIYREFCEVLQSIMQFNGRCHTFSHNVYAETVDADFIREFLISPLGSLYYRLPPSKAQSLNKEETWDDTDLTDLFDTPEETIDGFCPIDESCESCSM